MAFVFLDLDGTLTDSGPGIINAFNYALGQMGYPDLGDDANWVVGPSLWDSLTKLGMPAELHDQTVAHYRDAYRGGEMFNNRLYDGVLGQLSDLKSRGYRLCLATSKPIAYAGDIVAHFGVSDFLDYEFGSELDGTRTDKTELLAYGLAQTGCDPRDAIMIGDRHYDVIGARNNGMGCLGALYGFGTLDELTTASATDILHAATDMATAVTKHLKLERS